MKTLLWTLTRPCSKKWIKKFENINVKVVGIPFVKVTLLVDTTKIDAELKKLSNYDGIVFTSRHAVRFTCERLKILKAAMSIPIFCGGSATASEVNRQGFKPKWVQTEEITGRELALRLAKLLTSGSRLIFPKSTQADLKPWQALASRGIRVTPVDLYEPRTLKYHEGEKVRHICQQNRVCVAFGSPTGVKSWMSIWGSSQKAEEILKQSMTAAIGQTTKQALMRLKKSPEIVPDKAGADQLCSAIFRKLEMTEIPPHFSGSLSKQSEGEVYESVG